ncbi:MAG TPA: hypothetical protein VGT06_12500 [Candidatus Methylomirabilis sp.]|jgi:hypothetical protein|nr:hypothetical protein [Candidatus Methylomirabilis sp.]
MSARCRKCTAVMPEGRPVDAFERIRLADDPADPNCGHFYVETIHVLECPACRHRQEYSHHAAPYPTLREAQKELDSLELGKG